MKNYTDSDIFKKIPNPILKRFITSDIEIMRKLPVHFSGSSTIQAGLLFCL